MLSAVSGREPHREVKEIVKPREREPRINDRIKITPIRLIGADGEQAGILPTAEALERAQAAGLDLVEVSGTSKPPVCRIMDYGRYKYEASKKKKEARKKQHSTELKEMRFRPKVETHDYEFKTKHIREFLEEGNKVKVYVMFRGREMAHTEFGRTLLERVAEDMKELATVDAPPRQEGRRMNMSLSPLATVVKKASDLRAAKAKEKRRFGEDEPQQESLQDTAPLETAPASAVEDVATEKSAEQ